MPFQRNRQPVSLFEETGCFFVGCARRKKGQSMKPQDLTTENSENLNNRVINNSVTSVVKTSPKEFPLKEVTEKIISCAMEVHSTLGPGLLESIYEEALAHEFTLRGITYEKQKEIALKYKGKEIGKHRIDYLIENEVIVELKAVETMAKIYEAQILTYLKAMDKRVGLLINFNVERLKDGIKRLIL
jgi:GxxExxY protein